MFGLPSRQQGGSVMLKVAIANAFGILRRTRFAGVFSVLGLVLAGCAVNPAPTLDAVIWHQKAMEYHASTLTVYGNARVRLDQALADPDWSAAVEQDGMSPLPGSPAIVLDIDETVLNNSPLFARVAQTPDYDLGEGWTDWTAEARAKALAGAVDFIRYARSRGVTVFFVSNRSCTQDDPTANNLARVGFPMDDGGIRLISRNTDFADPDKTDSCPTMEAYVRREFGISDPMFPLYKGARRTAIAGKYRILLLFGDSQGDFYSLPPEPSMPDAERKRLLQAHLTVTERKAIQDRWGDRFRDRWMGLPNSMYGNWLSSFHGYRSLTPAEQVRTDAPRLSTH